ncbi:hypothetical protein [Methanosphaerula subterraneus]|uniref:hypothetical protein n=1 Tax=Methanosphaerula subterraneus TaxID=3350244 RepID=UPI003F838F51
MLAELVLVPHELLLAMKFWEYLGIRRISSTNVLDQEVRAQISFLQWGHPKTTMRLIVTGSTDENPHLSIFIFLDFQAKLSFIINIAECGSFHRYDKGL